MEIKLNTYNRQLQTSVAQLNLSTSHKFLSNFIFVIMELKKFWRLLLRKIIPKWREKINDVERFGDYFDW